jgi:flagellar hook assembly protein FlgD
MAGEFFGGMKSSPLSIQEPDFTASAHGFPNPFDPDKEQAHIEYYLGNASQVTIRIFTIAGRPVKELINKAVKQAGLHSEDTWAGSNSSGDSVKSGVYMAVIEAEDMITGKKMKAVRKIVVLR